jgi:hypothetical protein
VPFQAFLKHGISRVRLMDRRELGQTRTATAPMRMENHAPNCVRRRWRHARSAFARRAIAAFRIQRAQVIGSSRPRPAWSR